MHTQAHGGQADAIHEARKLIYIGGPGTERHRCGITAIKKFGLKNIIDVLHHESQPYVLAWNRVCDPKTGEDLRTQSSDFLMQLFTKKGFAGSSPSMVCDSFEDGCECRACRKYGLWCLPVHYILWPCKNVRSVVRFLETCERGLGTCD